MEYIASLVSFIAAVIGIVGDTWDKRKRGWRRLTRTGIGAVVFAVVSLTVAVLTAYHKDIEQRTALEQREMVRQIAKMELCLAAQELKVALDVLVSVGTGQRTADGSDIGLTFDQLLATSTTEKLEAMDLRQRPIARTAAGDRRSLDQFLSMQSRMFVEQTNFVLAKYSTFLNRELILKATWLSNNNFVRRLLVTSEQVEQVTNVGGVRYPGLWEYEREQYPEAVNLLKQLLMLTGGETTLSCKKPDAFK